MIVLMDWRIVFLKDVLKDGPMDGPKDRSNRDS